MLTEEDARRLVLAEIDDVRSHVTCDVQILRVEALPRRRPYCFNEPAAPPRP
ncbi:hypothetical protein [Streptomyces sp. NPDC050548]|uniref:hypothetical protein n=1 Tax=Streptomyces sp. NPDC050548 TaxID=3365629 RepID=UPI003787820F